MFPLLTPVARLLLGIPASSVASERTFSEAKLIDTRLRSSLGDEIFGDLIFISENLPSDDLEDFLRLVQTLAKHEASMKELIAELETIDCDEEDASELVAD